MSERKTGTREWAEGSLNMARGCSHDCRYCYARQMLVVRHKLIEPAAWPVMEVCQEAVDSGYGKRRGTIMMPTTHDITPEILEPFCTVLDKMLRAGNQVLLVSKPHRVCIERICEQFAWAREQILFRFTIGSINGFETEFWEPGAPRPAERMDCLYHAFTKGFATSVSCEPFLDRWTKAVYTCSEDWITDTFWIGRLRHWGSRVRLEGVDEGHRKMFVEPLRELLTDEYALELYEHMKDLPKVRWKDSIAEVVESRLGVRVN